MEEQHFNCTCPNGYHGNKCQSQTTFSLYGDSYIKIPSNRLVIFVHLIIRYFLLSWVFRCVNSIVFYSIHTIFVIGPGNVILAKTDMSYRCDSELRLEMVY